MKQLALFGSKGAFAIALVAFAATGPMAYAETIDSLLGGVAGLIHIAPIPQPSATASGGNADIEIFAPCELNSQSNTGLRKCTLAVDYPAAGASGPTGMIGLVQTRLQKQSDCLYTSTAGKDGVDLNSSLDTTGTGACVGDEFMHPCSIVGTQFTNAGGENEVDHNGRSCGNPAYITSNVSTSAKRIFVSMHYESVDGVPLGEYERSHMRGTFVQALDTKWSDVKASMMIRRSVVIKSQGGNPSPCSSFATVLQANQSTYQTAAAALASQLQSQIGTLGTQTDNSTNTNNLTTQVNISDIINCANLQGGQLVGLNITSNNIGSLRQSAQQLCAMRASLEAAFTQLAACESISEAQYAYITSYGGAQQMAQTIQQINKDMDPICRPQCKNPSGSATNAYNCSAQLSPDCEEKCGSITDPVGAEACLKTQCLPKSATQTGGAFANGGQCDPASNVLGVGDSLQQCLNKCYDAELPVWFKNQFTSAFPRAPLPTPPRQ